MKRIYPHRVGEYAAYRSNGVCRIEEITEKDFGGDSKVYYKMKSVYDDNMVFFVPADNDNLSKQIRGLLSVDEINAIISSSENSGLKWIDDSKKRLECFTEILKRGNYAEILWLVKVLSLHKIETESVKKKFYAADAKILEAAQRIITQEFAFVLGVKKEEVIPYIKDRLEQS